MRWHAQIQKVLSEGVQLYKKNSVAEGRENPNTTISEPLSACQRNAIEMAFRWRTDDGQTLNVGLVALGFLRDLNVYCYKTLYFCIFQGGGGVGPEPCRPLDPRMAGSFIALHLRKSWTNSTIIL